MSISSSAVLVELNISVWGATKLDKDATNIVISDNMAGKNSAQVRKNLLAGTSLRKDISDFAALSRLWNNKMTLNWSDKGARLLPTSLFMEHKQGVNVKQAHFNNLTQKLYDNYDGVIQTARNYMGGFFNEADYPSLEEVRSRFAFKIVYSPLPTSGDFRLDIPNADLQEVSKQYQEDYDARIEKALKGVWQDLFKLLSGMSDKLKDDGEGGDNKRYHDTLITNAQGMCAMLTNLNVTKDQKLEEARRALEGAIMGVNMDGIKHDGLVRKDVKSKVDDILSKFSW
jgi:hypothetical protein